MTPSTSSKPSKPSVLIRAGLLALVVLAPVAACAGERLADRVERLAQDELVRPSGPVSAPAAIAPSPALAGDAAKSTAEARARLSSFAAGGQLPAVRDTSTIASMIIRTGNASVLVDSLEAAVARVRELAARLGGFVANTAMQTGPEYARSATLTLRIPSARYDEALGGLQPLGEVETVHTNAEDVGEEYVDVQARVANARRLETRLVELLATRTGRLDDVLAVERELARVREEIERFEGRLRFLRARISLSTLTITVHEAMPLIGSNPSANVIGEAFVTAWRNFVAFLAGLIAALGWVVPTGVIAIAVAALGRRLAIRFVRRPRPLPPSDDAPVVATT